MSAATGGLSLFPVHIALTILGGRAMIPLLAFVAGVALSAGPRVHTVRGEGSFSAGAIGRPPLILGCCCARATTRSRWLRWASVAQPVVTATSTSDGST